jgi:thioredoxin-like negative regulator of GroEL
MGRAPAAAKVFREALQLQPSSLLIHESLFSALLETGATAQLCDQLESLNDVVQLDSSKKMLAELVERARKVIEIHDTTSKL